MDKAGYKYWREGLLQVEEKSIIGADIKSSDSYEMALSPEKLIQVVNQTFDYILPTLRPGKGQSQQIMITFLG